MSLFRIAVTKKRNGRPKWDSEDRALFLCQPGGNWHPNLRSNGGVVGCAVDYLRPLALTPNFAQRPAGKRRIAAVKRLN